MKILCIMTGKSGYPYDTGDHPYNRFKLKMPTPEGCDISWLEEAHEKAVNLSKIQLTQLKRLSHFISVFRFAYFPINYKILPTFYDLCLFTGSGGYWGEAYAWVLLKDRRKYEDLDLDLTLVLLTASLAGSDDGLGADRWYRMGITRKLLKHLIKLIEERQKQGRNMVKNNTNSLSKLEQNFRELIIEQCEFCGFDKYLEENPDFEFPKITEDLLRPDTQGFAAIPGMFGGFTYYLEVVDGRFVLYANQSSRMDYDDNSHLYFEVTENGNRLLDGEERKIIRKKFWELAKKAHEKRLRELKAMRRKAKD